VRTPCERHRPAVCPDLATMAADHSRQIASPRPVPFGLLPSRLTFT
jgi:hypothetical protein